MEAAAEDTVRATQGHEEEEEEDDTVFRPQMVPAAAGPNEQLPPAVKATKSLASSHLDAKKRLMKDLKSIQTNCPEGISAHPREDDLLHWTAVIFGPEDTAWEGGIFKLDLVFTDEYPMSPPKVKFLTPMFHPNVYRDGNICMDIMKSHWSPAYDIAALLLSIQSLLSDPNPASAANAEAAEMFAHHRNLYNERVAAVVEKSLELADDDDDDG